MKPKKAKPKLHSLIRSALRKIFMWSQTRREALKLSGYRCINCKLQFYYKELEVDHIVPVGPTPGSRNATADTTWDGFIARMFCGVEGLQVLCKRCHLRKTGENQKSLTNPNDCSTFSA